MGFTKKQIDFFKILETQGVDIITGYKKLSEGVYLNPYIFKDKTIPTSFQKHKKDFLKYLEIIKYNLNVLKNNNSDNSDIENTEIFYMLDRLSFLEDFYDIESMKIGNTINNYISPDIDYYNNIFFKKTNIDIININNNPIKSIHGDKTQIKISKDRLVELLNKIKEYIPEIEYIFGDFSYMSHSKGTLKIPDKSEYTLKNVVILFFHEITHFLRRLNQINNYGFSYSFSDYMDFEEGIAIYNEYYYGNMLLNGDYGEYFPVYDYLYSLLKYTSPDNRKQAFIEAFIKIKGVSKNTAEDYYYRFYRYMPVGGDKFFLKETCYGNGLKNIERELLLNPANYDRIMSGRIGYSVLKEFNNYGEISQNKNIEGVFEIIKRELKF